MRFTKMQGTGNDFVLVNCLESGLPEPVRLARQICDRHFGVGADGLVLVVPGDQQLYRMQIWNADGSQAAMCGNASRCLAVYLRDLGLFSGKELVLETASGPRILRFRDPENKGHRVQVNMGPARWNDGCLPVGCSVARWLDSPLAVDGRTFVASCVSMGNPHCVIFVDDLSDEIVSTWGPKIEKSAVFPERTNVEFVRRESDGSVRVRVWERGCGETLACGTGASAVFAVARAQGWASQELECQMNGGVLILSASTDHPNSDILMTGDAQSVYTGNYPWSPDEVV